LPNSLISLTGKEGYGAWLAESTVFTKLCTSFARERFKYSLCHCFVPEAEVTWWVTWSAHVTCGFGHRLRGVRRRVAWYRSGLDPFVFQGVCHVSYIQMQPGQHGSLERREQDNVTTWFTLRSKWWSL